MLPLYLYYTTFLSLCQSHNCHEYAYAYECFVVCCCQYRCGCHTAQLPVNAPKAAAICLSKPNIYAKNLSFILICTKLKGESIKALTYFFISVAYNMLKNKKRNIYGKKICDFRYGNNRNK